MRYKLATGPASKRPAGFGMTPRVSRGDDAAVKCAPAGSMTDVPGAATARGPGRPGLLIQRYLAAPPAMTDQAVQAGSGPIGLSPAMPVGGGRPADRGAYLIVAGSAAFIAKRVSIFLRPWGQKETLHAAGT